MRLIPNISRERLIKHDDKFKKLPEILEKYDANSINEAIEIIDKLSDPLMVTVYVYEVFRNWIMDSKNTYNSYKQLVIKYKDTVKYLYDININYVRNDINKLNDRFTNTLEIIYVRSKINVSCIIEACIDEDLEYLCEYVQFVPNIEYIIRDVPKIELLYYDGYLQLNEKALKWYSVELLKKIIIGNTN